MRSHNDFAKLTGVAFGSLRHNPITHSVYVQDNNDGSIAPGAPQFIVTEGSPALMITTETGVPLVTES